MPHAITGKAGAVSIGGSAVNGKLTSWRLRASSTLADDTGAGEAWESKVQIRNDWEASCEGYVPDQAAMHVLNVGETLLGTEAALTLKFRTGDSNPYFSDTGQVESFEVNAPIDGPATFTFTVRSSAGDAPTFDTTPA